MTERIYYEDSHARRFRAVVLACEERKKGWRIALDRTAFFPEGGGQFGDQGTLCPAGGERVRVTDTQERDGLVWHDTDAPIEAGTEVEGELDWALRFARMQCHSGEHIVSGLFHTLYGLDNVGFHLGDEEMTLDLSGPVTWEDVKRVERLANGAVAENLPIECRFPPAEELAELDYRSKLDLKENVRIVTIPGYDVCACCAPHVKYTGEIGLIHALGMQNWKGGVRLRVLCGSRAVEDVMAKQESITAVSGALSAKQGQVVPAVERICAELEETRLRAGRLSRALAQAKAESLPENAPLLVLFEELDTDGLRALVNAAVGRGTGICAAYCREGDRFQYILGSAAEDLRVLVKEMNRDLSGRGGGSRQMVQGSLTARRAEIEAWWKRRTEG